MMMMTSAKICKATEFFLLHFLKLHNVLSISAKFQVYSPIRNKVGGGGGLILPPHEQIRGQNITVEIGLTPLVVIILPQILKIPLIDENIVTKCRKEK